MARADFKFSHRFRVRYAEVDPQAVVFNSRYLEYADLMLTEYWRAAGVHQAMGREFEVHVVRAVVDYRKPIRVDEQVDGFIRVARFGTSSLTFAIELHGADAEDLRAGIELVHVHVELHDNRPRPVPDAVRAVLAALS